MEQRQGRTEAISWDTIISRLKEFLRCRKIPVVSEVAHRDRDPFRVLVSCMISLRTKDEVTGQASERLFARASNPEELGALEEEEIASLIYPAGFYNTKAKNLKQTARLLAERYGGRVPREIKQLLSLPGVGRKTANLVRNLGYGLDGICVDTHVHRISNRLGWVRTRSPEQTEQALRQILPRRYWIPINELLVTFGQNLCTPVSPFCSRCPIYDCCQRVGVTRSR